jgi:regulator of sigma E protease
MVSENSPADLAGIQKGDKILKINDTEINLSNSISKVINSVEGDVNVTIQREDEILNLTMSPIKEGERRIIGIYPVNIVNPEYITINRSIGEAVVQGVEESYNAVWTTIKGLGMLFSGQADIAKNVAGPIGIFTLIGRAGATQPFVDYLKLIGLISVLLGFFNLLPIPAVDGGHIVLTIIEMIRRKPLSMKIIQTVQIIGVVLILTLFVIVAIKDIINLPEMFKMFG